MRAGFALLTILVAACGGEGTDLPVGGGGNFDGGFGRTDGSTPIDASVVVDSTVGDATSPSPVDAALLVGRVCLANDPRKLNDCATTGAGGLTVRLGNNTATTAADGSFTIPAATGTWRVTGSNIVTSIMVLADYEIPAITRTAYDSMLMTNLGTVQLNPGEGSVMLQVIRNGVGQPSATAVPTPPSSWMPFYDNPASQTDWNQGSGTDADGTIWIPGFDVGTASVEVTSPSQPQPITKSGIPIVDGAITFATVIFP